VYLSYAVKKQLVLLPCIHMFLSYASRMTTSTLPLHYCVDVLCGNTTSGTTNALRVLQPGGVLQPSEPCQRPGSQSEPPPHARLDCRAGEAQGTPRGVGALSPHLSPPWGVLWRAGRPTGESPSPQPCDAQGRSGGPRPARDLTRRGWKHQWTPPWGVGPSYLPRTSPMECLGRCRAANRRISSPAALSTPSGAKRAPVPRAT